MSVDIWNCHSWPLDDSRHVKILFWTTRCKYPGKTDFSSYLFLVSVYISAVLPGTQIFSSTRLLSWLTPPVSYFLTLLQYDTRGVYHKIHLVTFLYIFLLVDFFKWALIDHIEKRRFHSELCQFETGGVYHKIHLVTFLYIFLLVDCFKWALIDYIAKRRVHSELCQFQFSHCYSMILGGYIIRFTWWHFFISAY